MTGAAVQLLRWLRLICTQRWARRRLVARLLKRMGCTRRRAERIAHHIP
jgi:hypothetical protein